tara:strand:- start:2867 stop:4069 length:1203 start_codon:yes stop_codon:yes gene_type:complete
MHKFIYPTKDAWINELTSSQNYGYDEVLELKKDLRPNTTQSRVYGVSRILTQFDLTDVSKSIVSGKIGTDAKYNLRLYSTEAHSLPKTYTLVANPISESWEEGTGKYSDDPIRQNGVTWDYRNQSNTNLTWEVSSSDAVSSGSRNIASGSETNKSGSKGGGVWYTGSKFDVSQSFSYASPDINMDVTDIVHKWLSGSTHNTSTYPNGIENNGFILRLSGSSDTGLGLENDDTNFFNLKFFSRNTHTIYPPKLEIKWDDRYPSTGPLTGSYTSLDMTGEVDNYVYVKGLKETYKETETVRFRIGARKRYINKTFSTSVQTVTGSFIADTSGSYSVVDTSTGETLVPFGDYSLLSLDSSSMYFNQDLNSFQPNRIYKIMVRVKYNDGQEVIYDNDSEFKVVR